MDSVRMLVEALAQQLFEFGQPVAIPASVDRA
jgi:hypothetical protein